MDRRSFDDKGSEMDAEADLPMSTSTTEARSMDNVADTSSTETLAPHIQGPNWPKTWRAYACWLGCFFLMFNSWGLVNAYGTFASYYVGHSLRDKDQLQLNLIGSTQSALVLLFSAPVGRLLDAGHFRAVIATGAFLVPFGMFLLSIVHPKDPEAFGDYGKIWATQGLVVGLGMACFFVSSSQIAATWFPNRKGLAVGFVACGASIAGVIYPTMTRYLIHSMGFINTVRMVATVVAVTSIYALVFATPNPAHAHPRPQSYRSWRTWIDPDAFKNKAFVWQTIAIAFLFFGFYPVFFNLEEWAAVQGYGTRQTSLASARVPTTETPNDPLQTFWLLTIMNGASTVGRLTMAAFSDRVGPLNMHITSMFISALFVVILWTLAASTTAAIAFCIFFGMTSGAVIGLPPASMANILGCTYTSPQTHHLRHQKLGQWTGMMYTLAAFPSLTGPIISGHLVTVYKNYITVQMWAGGNMLAAAICMCVARYYLPCVDGERVGDKIRVFGARRRGGAEEEEVERGRSIERERGSEVEVEVEGKMSFQRRDTIDEERRGDVV